MNIIRVVSDLDECRRIWRQVAPRKVVSDLWEFRSCFHRYFKRQPHFITVESSGKTLGLLPLCWIEESDCFGYFPGETWNGQTWLEQNRIFAANNQVLDMLRDYLETTGIKHHLRYLLPSHVAPSKFDVVDEIGYLFLPPKYNYRMEPYYAQFSGKSIKQITRELNSFETRCVTYRLDDPEDFELMLRMNQDRYGLYSYFAEPRFAGSFRDMMQFLHSMGWLRMTTVLVGGQPAAVDMGCIYKGTYTLFAGGTDENFPGIAKLINLFHMRRACEEKWSAVDFLCGDFSWKSRFHLTPRPLYLLSNTVVQPIVAPTLSVHTVTSPLELTDDERRTYAF